MRESRNKLTEKEMELARMLMSECNTTADVQSKLKRLFAGTIEQMLEAEMDEHLGYEKNSVLGNNSGNSRNGYGKKRLRHSSLGYTLSLSRAWSAVIRLASFAASFFQIPFFDFFSLFASCFA